MYFINKNYLFSLSISSLLLFSACDNIDYSSTDDKTKTINGIAVDGYLENSKVCLDINKDGICNNNEPSSVTSEDGKFSLTTTLNGDYPLLIFGGTDTATQESFLGTLKTTISLNNNKLFKHNG
jgi:hypothetical protein